MKLSKEQEEYLEKRINDSLTPIHRRLNETRDALNLYKSALEKYLGVEYVHLTEEVQTDINNPSFWGRINKDEWVFRKKPK